MTADQIHRQARLDRYEQKTTVLMVSLALGYIVLFSIEVLAAPDLSTSQLDVLEWVSNAIWIVFILDLMYRTWLAPHRVRYLVTHPIDVIAVVLPSFRAFRVLRVLTAGQWLMTDGKRLTYGRTGAAIVVAVTMIVYLGSLAVLDAERGIEGSNINSFGQALWFSFVTITTVGYGDASPVTVTGRVIAVGIMVLGISLIGVVSATVATSFLERIRGQERARDKAAAEAEEVEEDLQHAAVMAKLDRLEAHVAALTAELVASRPS